MPVARFSLSLPGGKVSSGIPEFHTKQASLATWLEPRLLLNGLEFGRLLVVHSGSFQLRFSEIVPREPD